MAELAENEMKANCAMPERVSSNEGLGLTQLGTAVAHSRHNLSLYRESRRTTLGTARNRRNFDSLSVADKVPCPVATLITIMCVRYGLAVATNPLLSVLDYRALCFCDRRLTRRATNVDHRLI